MASNQEFPQEQSSWSFDNSMFQVPMSPVQLNSTCSPSSVGYYSNVSHSTTSPASCSSASYNNYATNSWSTNSYPTTPANDDYYNYNATNFTNYTNSSNSSNYSYYNNYNTCYDSAYPLNSSTFNCSYSTNSSNNSSNSNISSNFETPNEPSYQVQNNAAAPTFTSQPSPAPVTTYVPAYAPAPASLETSAVSKSNTGARMSRKHQLPDKAVDILNEWFDDHVNNPYPSIEQKEKLARRGDISVKQVNAWFSNRRNRSQNTKPKRMKRVLEHEIHNIFNELVSSTGASNKQHIIEKFRSTLANHEIGL